MEQILNFTDMRISPNAYWLLKVLASMRPEKLIDLSFENLAIEARMGYRSVKRHVKVLRTQGLIKCERTSWGRGKTYSFEVLRDGMRTDWAPRERVG